MAHDAGALMHSDLAQSVGKLPWTVDSLAIDLGRCQHTRCMARRESEPCMCGGSCRVAEQQHGGHHERGMRSGTLPTHQIVGMGEAYRIAQLESHAEIERLNQYRDQIEAAIEQVGGIRCNGQRGVPHILNITIEGWMPSD